MFQALRSLIPPPQYMTLPSVGVDVSESSLKYIRFIRGHDADGFAHLAAWGDIPLPEGAVTRGNVQDTSKLADGLAEVKKQTGLEYVRLSLPEERAYLFQTEVKKGTPFREIRGQLEFRLEENVPLSPRDAYFDYEIYEAPDSQQKLNVAVTVYARETVNGYYEACQKAGVIPLSFEIEAQAIARASIPEGDLRTYMIVDFGKTRTGVGIVHQGILMYTSTIDIGGKELSVALRKVLGDRPESELTEIKNTQGLVAGQSTKGVYEALHTAVADIQREIALRIQYWNERLDVGPDRYIHQILLCGGSVNLNGFPEYLTTGLGIETVRGNVWQNAFPDSEFVPPIEKRFAYGYATAIGLGLGSLL